MKSRYRVVIAAAVALSLTALSACSSGGNSGSGSGDDASFSKTTSGTLKAWGFNNADDVGTSRLDYAKSQMKGVTITLDKTSFDAQKFTTRVASGNVPDVVQMDRQYVATYAAQKLIMPLDKCFSTYGVDPDKQYYPFVMDDVRYDSHVWAVPQFYQPPAIILNKRVMKQAGVTAAEIDTSKPDTLVAAVKKMSKSSGGNPTVLGFDPGATTPALWMLLYGGKIIDSSGKPALDDPANAKGFEVLKRIIDADGGWAKVKSFIDTFDTFGDKNPYVKDQVGSQQDAQWYVNVLSPYTKQIDIAAVPLKDSAGKPFAVAGGTSFVIPANAKNKDAACKWMIDLTSQKAWLAAGAARAATLKKTPGAINTGLFTGSPEADQAIRTKFVKTSGNTQFDQTIDTYYTVLKGGKSYGASPAGQQIQSELGNAITSYLLGEKTAKQALTQAQSASMRAYKTATR